MVMLGKSRRWTSRGSSIPLLVQITCLGCSSTDMDLSGSGTGTGHLLCSLPLAELTEFSLSGHGGGLYDLEEKLTGPGVENEDHAFDGLGCEVDAQHRLDISVVEEPDDGIVEDLAVVGAGEVGLRHVAAVRTAAALSSP